MLQALPKGGGKFQIGVKPNLARQEAELDAEPFELSLHVPCKGRYPPRGGDRLLGYPSQFIHQGIPAPQDVLARLSLDRDTLVVLRQAFDCGRGHLDVPLLLGVEVESDALAWGRP